MSRRKTSTLDTQLPDRNDESSRAREDLTHLIASSDIATVFLDTELRLKQFTPAAARLFNLTPSDVARPIAQIATHLLDLDLSSEARTVLQRATPLEKAAGSTDGNEYLVRIRPYLAENASVAGVTLTLVNVTAFIESVARAHADLEQRFADQTRWLHLMRDVSQTINDSLTWEDALHRVLERLCETEHWQIGFVYLPQSDSLDVLAPVIGCLRDDHLRRFSEVSAAQRFPRKEALPGRVYSDGQPVWLDDQQAMLALMPRRARALAQTSLRSAALVPVTLGRDVIGVLELFSTEPHPPGEHRMFVIQDVSAQIARILEGERATAQMADLVWREQQGLLHTLHDTLGQTLTGLGMLSSGLSQQLSGANLAAAAAAQQVARQAQIALEQVRQLARGFPVDVEAKDLMPALRQLASTTESLHRIPARVHGTVRHSVRDTRVATQLYRIAQEAVTNAIKHGRPTAIAIEIAVTSGLATLRIIDNGVGIRNTDGREEGLGIRIMRYRSTSIGAQLTIEPGPDCGTIVTCTMRETPASTARLASARHSRLGISRRLQ
jgi:signal transduction histidine kinase